MIRVLLLSLVLTGSVHAGVDDVTDGTLYAPESISVAAEATESPLPSYYSTARLEVIDISHPSRTIEGVDLFINGQYVGKSPLDLTGYLVDTPTVSVSATLDGYSPALRPALRLPAQGEVKVAVAGDAAANWYTYPAFAVSIAMLGGASAAYAQDTPQSAQTGLALVCGAVGVLVVSQIVAHFFHLPRLRKSARVYNEKPEPAP